MDPMGEHHAATYFRSFSPASFEAHPEKGAKAYVTMARMINRRAETSLYCMMRREPIDCAYAARPDHAHHG